MRSASFINIAHQVVNVQKAGVISAYIEIRVEACKQSFLINACRHTAYSRLSHQPVTHTARTKFTSHPTSSLTDANCNHQFPIVHWEYLPLP